MTKEGKLMEKVAIQLISQSEDISFEEASKMWGLIVIESQKGHFGDCIKEPQSCALCFVERQYEKAILFLALVNEAGWIDPATLITLGEFGTPQADKVLHEWAIANGYVPVAHNQTLPRQYGKVAYERLLAILKDHKIKESE